jgi:hypothetical protein
MRAALGVVNTQAAACRTVSRSMRCQLGRALGSSGAPGCTMGSRKSATHGRPLRRCSSAPMRWAVGIGCVVQMASGRYWRINSMPTRTAWKRQLAYRSGHAVRAM